MQIFVLLALGIVVLLGTNRYFWVSLVPALAAQSGDLFVARLVAAALAVFLFYTLLRPHPSRNSRFDTATTLWLPWLMVNLYIWAAVAVRALSGAAPGQFVNLRRLFSDESFSLFALLPVFVGIGLYKSVARSTFSSQRTGYIFTTVAGGLLSAVTVFAFLYSAGGRVPGSKTALSFLGAVAVSLGWVLLFAAGAIVLAAGVRLLLKTRAGGPVLLGLGVAALLVGIVVWALHSSKVQSLTPTDATVLGRWQQQMLEEAQMRRTVGSIVAIAGLVAAALGGAMVHRRRKLERGEASGPAAALVLLEAERVFRQQGEQEGQQEKTKDMQAKDR